MTPVVSGDAHADLANPPITGSNHAPSGGASRDFSNRDPLETLDLCDLKHAINEGFR